MKILTPTLECLDSCKAALARGWSPNTLRPEAAAEELEAALNDPHGFVARLTDLDARGSPIRMPDGTLAARLPGFNRWLWDGEFCGTIGFRWQPGTEALPAHVPGHIGYSVVPWKRGQGYATAALSQLLTQLGFTGLRHVTIVTDPANRASQRVVEKCGAVFLEDYLQALSLGGGPVRRYRISLPQETLP